jgi:hypothetical protein
MDEPQNSPAPVRELPLVRSTAWLLIVAGVLELIHGAYTSPPNQIKFNIMFLAAGLLLYFGSARVIAVVRWIALSAAVPAIVMLLLQTLVLPLDLTMVQLRLFPRQTVMFVLPLLITAVVTNLVAWRLHRKPVRSALEAHGRKPAGLALPVALGLLLSTIGVVMMVRMLSGPEARHAEQLVAQKMGPNYKYFTNRLHIVKNEGTTVFATVQVWNDKESWQVPVRWRP